MGHLSIRTKLQLMINGVVLVICVSTVALFYHQARQALLNQVRMRLASVADCISVQIDPRVHNALRSEEDQAKPEYARTKAVLRRFMAANTDIKDVYTMRPGKNPAVWEFVVDGDNEEPAATGEEYDVTSYPELVAALSKPSADTQVTRDKWGYWLSGYAPIKDASGRSIGIVGVDMSVDQLRQEMTSVYIMGVLAIALAVFLSVVLSQIICSFLTTKVSVFVERLNAAARGDLDTLVDDERNDEIGEVARAFNYMLLVLQNKDKMIREMNTDYLTGLNNHRYFQQRLHEEIIRAQECPGEVALLMLDIDMFKLVNDSFGHVVGDEILKQVAELLMQNLDESQFAARYGGEEFAVIIPDTDLQGATELAERLHRVISEASFEIPPELTGETKSHKRSTVTVTMSIGIAVYPIHSRKQDGLIMAADIALYRAKHMGRDRVCAYNTVEEAHMDPYHVYTFIRDPSRSAIEALAAAVDARDHYTRNHSEQVSKYALMIGGGLNMKEGERDLLRMAGLLHDVGKIGVPDYVLNKPTSLSEEERNIIRTHPALGESIIRNSHNLDAVLPAILYHHEHFDGKGYPAGLAGKDIPLAARIIAVADAFDALLTSRPYRKSLTTQEAVEELRRNSGTQFDPEIVEAFIKAVESSAELERDSLDQAA